MVRSPFGSFGNIPWSLVAGLFLFTAGVPFLSPGVHLLADQPPARKAIFEGKWNGKYEDNQRNTGEGEYEFREDNNGRLTVKVSWKEKGETKVMELTGERLGPDAMRLTGKYKDTSYRYIGGMEGDELKLHYEEFVDKKTGKSGFGLSRLTRPTIKCSNGIYYLELTGTPTEMGMRHGAAFKKLIREQVADYRKNVLETFGKKNGERILQYVVKESKFITDIKKHFPHVYEEMEGIAKGAELEIDDILLLQMYEEVYEGAAQELKFTPLKREGGKCTTLTCAGRKGLPNLNAQNLDYTSNLNGAQLMIHYTYPSGLKILMYTFAGQVGGIGANNKGLSMVCNTLPEGSKRKNDGLGGTYITRGLLEQGSVAEAVAWLKKMPQFGSYNYSLTDFNESLMVEYSPKGLAVLEVPMDRQYLAHTNHLHKLEDRNEIPDYPGGRPKETTSTAVRQKAADKQMAGKGATATVADLKAILTAAPVNRALNSKGTLTLQSIIIVHDPGDPRVYASAGNDPKRSWNLYQFK